MLFPAIGMTTAVWLMAAPLTGLEVGGRADLAVAVGAVAFAAALLGVWFRALRPSLVVLAIVLGFANFVLMAPTISLASMATCAFGLLAAGTAPRPVVASEAAAPASVQPALATAAAPAAVAAPIPVALHDEIPTAPHRLSVAA